MRSLLFVLGLALSLTGNAQDVRYGAFTVVFRTDPMTDDVVNQMYSLAIDPPALQSGAGLWIACDPDGPQGVDAWVWADEYLGADGIAVDYRLDDEPAVVETRWVSSNDGTAAYLPWDLQAELLPILGGHDELRVRVYDYRDVPYDFRFSVVGFDDALAAIGCWQPSGGN